MMAVESVLRSDSETRISAPHRFYCARSDSGIALGPYASASSFHQDHIAPVPVHAADSFSRSNNAEAAAFMYFNAGNIFREDARLERPHTCLL